MANNDTTDKTHGHVLEVTAPGDYGLSQDDGFDPSKYDFYNPLNRGAAKTFVVRLDEFVFILEMFCCIRDSHWTADSI